MRVPAWMFVVGLLAFVALTAVCSVFSYGVARQLAIDFGAPEELPTQAPFVAAQPSATPAPPTRTPEPGTTLEPEPEVTPGPSPTPDPLQEFPVWNDLRRITILLMGIDQRSAVDTEERAFRTDTMILVQIDPVRRAIGVLSIPRDLWVDIPGYQQGRITTANYLGDRDALPQGGPGLAMDTVRANIGVRVNHYVRINFEVFTSVVDTIAPDGVEVCVSESIVDDHYPDEGFGTITVRFDPGCQVLNAERLLQYARTRATAGSDFDRNRRQQEVLAALQNEVISAGGILNFITQIPSLYNQLQDNFVTSLSLQEIISLGRLVAEIPREHVTFSAIGPGDVQFSATRDGTQQILIPIQSGISRAVAAAFNPPETNLSLAELRQRAENENARIVVFNNTDIPGLAGQTRDWLNSRQVRVEGLGNIEPSQSVDTILYDYTGNTWTVRYLAELLRIPPERIQVGTDTLTDADVMIAVGPEIQALLSGQ